MLKSFHLFYMIVWVSIGLLGEPYVLAQKAQPLVEPPALKNGKGANSVIAFIHRIEVNTFKVITVRFKLTDGGFLDTLHVSANASTAYVETVRKQLLSLDGQWHPQKVNGRPVKSKWLVMRVYIAGFLEDTSDCNQQLYQQFLAAFDREADLFPCDRPGSRALACLIEGYDAYLVPPLLSTTVR